MVMDDDTVVELECHNEETGTGKSLRTETDEGYSVLVDQSTRPTRRLVNRSCSLIR